MPGPGFSLYYSKEKGEGGHQSQHTGPAAAMQSWCGRQKIATTTPKAIPNPWITRKSEIRLQISKSWIIQVGPM